MFNSSLTKFLFDIIDFMALNLSVGFNSKKFKNNMYFRRTKDMFYRIAFIHLKF